MTKLKPAMFDGNHHGLGAIFHAEAVQNFLHIPLDCVLTEIELRGYLRTESPCATSRNITSCCELSGSGVGWCNCDGERRS